MVWLCLWLLVPKLRDANTEWLFLRTLSLYRSVSLQ